MSAMVCNVFDVMLRTPEERNNATMKIKRIVLILGRLITIGNVPNLYGLWDTFS